MCCIRSHSIFPILTVVLFSIASMEKLVAANAHTSSVFSPDVILKCGDIGVNRIACIPKHNLVAVSTHRVYVYDYATTGVPIRVFSGSTRSCNSAVHLCDDILASVHSTGVVLTWRARTGVVVHKLKVTRFQCTSITKVSESSLVVGTSAGELILVKHANGNNLAVSKQCVDEKVGPILDISVYNDILFVVGANKSQVWNFSTCQLLQTIGRNLNMAVAISDDLIVLGDLDRLRVHRIRDGFKLVKTIVLPMPADDISFLSADIIMVTMRFSGIRFISVQSGQCISCCKLHKPKDLSRATLLSDGRVCIGGSNGFCAIFKLPKETESFISKCSQPFLSSLGPSSLAGGSNEGVQNNIELIKKLEWMEQRNKEQEIQIGKMKVKNKKQESQIENIKMQNKRQ